MSTFSRPWQRILSRYAGEGRVAGIAGNFAWLGLERLLRLAVSLVVTGLVARHLGPVQFGLLGSAFALAAIAGAFIPLGLDGTAPREMVREPSERRPSILGTAAALQLVAALFAYLLLNGGLMLSDAVEPDFELLVALISLLFLLQPVDVISYSLQADLRSKHAAAAQMLAVFAGAGARLAGILATLPLVFFGAVFALERLIGQCGLLLSARGSVAGLRSWRFEPALARRMLGESWPLGLATLFSLVTLMADRLVILHFHGEAEVGVYSAALVLSQMWVTLMVALGMSLSRYFVEESRTQPTAGAFRSAGLKVFSLVQALGLLVALGTGLIAFPLIQLIFGAAYGGSAAVLTVHVLGLVGAFHAIIRTHMLVTEGLQRFALLFAAQTMMCNLALNLLLVPQYGAMGAAWAYVISQFVDVLINPLFIRSTRAYPWLLCRAFLPDALRAVIRR